MTPNQKKLIRTSMTKYCKAAEANEVHWHYSQQRPFSYTDNPSAEWVSKDCSGYVGNVFWNAMHDLHIFLADPLGYRYTGVGNTWTSEEWLRENGKKVTEVNGYWIGDIVRWGQGHLAHMAVCRTNGTAKTSWWSSHGREAGPMPVRLDYRDDFVGVWRHPALL